MAACRMSDLEQHIPVLLTEAVTHLVTAKDGIYVDATFGRGSHSRAILNQLNADGRLIALDKDPEAIQFAKTHFASDERFQIEHTSFANMQKVLTRLNVHGAISGVLFDLGVSSPQLDTPERGFSFNRNGRLDMRMDTTQGTDAATFIATINEQALADILWQYGEEKASRRIARAIVLARAEKPITTTAELAAIISSVLPRRYNPHDRHPATRSFQAIRIAINDELNELPQGLEQAYNTLKIGGRIAAISFHSLEDRIVKHFIRRHEQAPELPRGLPVKATVFESKLRSIGKAIKPSEMETSHNPRARSAVLRIAEKKS